MVSTTEDDASPSDLAEAATIIEILKDTIIEILKNDDVSTISASQTNGSNENGVITSTLHQSFKYYKHEIRKIDADTKPFFRG